MSRLGAYLSLCTSFIQIDSSLEAFVGSSFRSSVWHDHVSGGRCFRATCSTETAIDCTRRRRLPRRWQASIMALEAGPSGVPASGVESCEKGDNDGFERIVRQTKAWVGDIVVRMRLCPFAEAVFGAKRGVRYVVSSAANTDDLWVDFLREVDHLMAHDREEVATTLLMAPRCLGSLVDFNDFCAWLEETIENDEVLVDQVLVACFHPKHAFHGLEDDDVLNYEKRSPHPTINILRAEMVDEYMMAGRTLGITEHNERRLRSEGKEAVKIAFEATLALK